ncbi:MAG: hypothetical protein U1F66_11705 [bacterium]
MSRHTLPWLLLSILTACSGMATGPGGGGVGGGDTRAVPVTMEGGAPGVQSERGDDLLYILVKFSDEQLPPANDSLTGTPQQKISGQVTCYRKGESSRLCPANRVLRIADTQANRFVETRLGDALGEARHFEVIYTPGGTSVKDGKLTRTSWYFFLNDQEGYQPEGLGMQKECVESPDCIPKEGWIREIKTLERETTVQAEPPAPVGVQAAPVIPQANSLDGGTTPPLLKEKPAIDLE